MYPLLRQFLFNFPPEGVHHFSMNMLRDLNRLRLFDSMLSRSFQVKDPALRKEVFGLSFPNPVGLGAGFDKNAVYLNELAALGFGSVEIGTVTPLPQPGNEKPRLFRLPKDKALVNRMGFNNNGVKAVRGRMENWRRNTVHRELIVGGNIGKNKLTPNDTAWRDYTTCFSELFDVVDYFVVNVSSPNTPGLRELQEKDSLKKIFGELQQLNQGRSKPKPILLKIAPDLTTEQLDDIVSLALETPLDGLVATNTTISREGLRTDPEVVKAIGAGGLSGKPLQQRSTEVLAWLSRQTAGRIPLVASGGIFTGEDAEEKLRNGASLVQVWTGFIYEGPAIAKKICKHLKNNKQHNY